MMLIEMPYGGFFILAQDEPTHDVCSVYAKMPTGIFKVGALWEDTFMPNANTRVGLSPTLLVKQVYVKMTATIVVKY